MEFQEAYPTFTPAPQATPFLLADFEHITLSQIGYTADRTLEFVITDDHGTEYSHTEIFTPVDDLTEIYDVHELLRPYFDRSDVPGLTGFSITGMKYETNRNVTLTIRQYTGNAIYFEGTYNVAYSDTPSDAGHTGIAGIGSRFLLRDNMQDIGPDQYASVSWFGHGEVLNVKLLHYVDGTPTLTLVASLTSQNTNALHSYNFTLRDLAEMVDVDIDDVIYVDFQLFRNDSPMDSARFTHDTRHRAHERTFAFIGPMGEPEFVTMTGKEAREAEFEGLFLQEHNHYRKASTTLHKIHQAYTGPLSEGQRELIWDMAASPWVYTIEDDTLVEVTITEVELNDSIPHTEPIGLSVKWRYAGEYRQRTFHRQPMAPHIRVFDSTFDETFE